VFGLLGRPEGLERLGGVDFDEVVFEHVREALPEAFATLDPADPAVLAAVARIRRDCTEAKEALSADTEVTIPVLLPAARGSVRLHRSEFEGLVRTLVEETVTALRAAVASAELTPEQLTAVLLVGGSSRIPLVTQLVSEGLGRPVAVDADPKNAIAKGAALAVSPKPTASWPGVAVPPLPAVAPAGSGAAAVATAGGPTRSSAPPRPALTPPRGEVRVVGPVHEPAGSPLSGRHPGPDPAPHRPGVRPSAAAPPLEQGNPAPGTRRRLLVGAGALVAAAVVVLAIVLLTNAPAGFDGTGSTVGGAVPSLGDPGSAVPATGDAGPAGPAAPGPGGGGGGGSPSDAGAGAGTGTGRGGGAAGTGGGAGGSGPAPGGAAPGGGAPPAGGATTAPDGVVPPVPGVEPPVTDAPPPPPVTPVPDPAPPTGGAGDPTGGSTPTGDASGGGDAGGGPGDGGTGGGPTGVPVDTGTAAGGTGGTADPTPSTPATV
jgi:hypothetical protein